MSSSLAAPEQHRLQLQGGVIRQRARSRADAGGEEREHGGIDRVGLGQATERLREVAHLARVHHRDG
jgi:hypothetical protein